mmetsp:Transcript_2890/g.7219  ORF Transcript_2890/g.7219 Transcript_2890/m.7219 type:complete len:227 (+) Transcript_2890:162-842(+)
MFCSSAPAGPEPPTPPPSSEPSSFRSSASFGMAPADEPPRLPKRPARDWRSSLPRPRSPRPKASRPRSLPSSAPCWKILVHSSSSAPTLATASSNGLGLSPLPLAELGTELSSASTFSAKILSSTITLVSIRASSPTWLSEAVLLLGAEAKVCAWSSLCKAANKASQDSSITRPKCGLSIMSSVSSSIARHREFCSSLSSRSGSTSSASFSGTRHFTAHCRAASVR